MFGLFTIFLVHFTLFASLRRQVIERARLTAINVGDNAAGYLFKNNAKGSATYCASTSINRRWPISLCRIAPVKSSLTL